MCALYGTSKRGPHKHVTGKHCSIVMVPCVITCVKMKLQLSDSVGKKSVMLPTIDNCFILYNTSYTI